MCIRDSLRGDFEHRSAGGRYGSHPERRTDERREIGDVERPVSYTHLRAHETVLDLVCRLLLEKKKTSKTETLITY